MNYKVKNQNMSKELQKAETSEGYLIVISGLNNGNLYHSTFTQKFNRQDIPTCLMHYNKLLSNEMGASVVERVQITKEEKKLPPRYRKS